MDRGLSLRRYGPALAAVGAIGLLQSQLRRHTPRFDPPALAEAEARLLAGIGPTFSHRFVQAGSHQIHTVVGGAGEPLVMLHGHGGGVGVWHRVLGPLAARYRVHALDWLGWGRSARPTFRGKSAAQARSWWLLSLEGWRRAMGLERFTLVGHSLGGWLATEYALAYPHRVKRLVLLNPAGLSPEVTIAKGLLYRVSPQRLVQACGPWGQRLVHRGVGDLTPYCADLAPALLDYYYHLSLAPLSGQIAFEQLLDLQHWHLPLIPRAAALAAPTTILWGLNDELFRLRDAHHFAVLATTARPEIILCPEARHSPHIEQPAPMLEALL